MGHAGSLKTVRLDIANHADNVDPLQTPSKSKLELLAEWILTLPILPCEGLIDHRNRLGLIRIEVGEIASRDQRNFHGVKILRIDHSNVRNRAALRFRCAPLNGKLRVVSARVHGQSV